MNESKLDTITISEAKNINGKILANYAASVAKYHKDEFGIEAAPNLEIETERWGNKVFDMIRESKC